MNASFPAVGRVTNPIKQFINSSSASGIVLFISALLSLLIANSFLSETFALLWQTKFTIGIGAFKLSKPLLYWINDGLMSMFFFVVGLELKREILEGELSRPRNALLPIVAGIGGMLMPALIYWRFNANFESISGWGIPMATDIAFALGVLFLLGKRVPLSLKIFLTALAIIDDLGAVLVIAIFYTSKISLLHVGIGLLFLGLMFGANRLGIRHVLVYGVLGIGGLWLAFLLSGVHATIAAVLAAFTIPASVRISKVAYEQKMKFLLARFEACPPTSSSMITPQMQEVLDDIKITTDSAIPPLQKLEHAMHPLVAFVVMPIFALANAGVALSGDIGAAFKSPVALGVMFGLILGKVVGIVGFVFLFEKLKIVKLPKSLTYLHLIGVAFLAAIGFTMSLFITSLAFENETYILQAKIGILSASFIAGLIGYFILKFSLAKPSNLDDDTPSAKEEKMEDWALEGK
ncbi:Na+/H+ antiporter NhaA [Hugenholtzia roseola]|uniref:Na+/H+ antiporter NhaA n=1 Tax=Hugenholtzia roseola TaxID=1002 RepID=UPI0003FC9151|nr:Na+/H+ antiporter NhaA [Hugenholtzia roseola]